MFNMFKKKSNIEQEIAQILFNNSMVISTAESCTGGLLSSRLTDVSGSSLYTKLNFVTYSNDVKQSLLGVSAQTLETFGAVSKECAAEMAVGLHSRTNADVVVCTTGIAGPTGGTPTKPVGLMYVAIKSKYKAVVQEFRLNPKLKRSKMKYQFTQCALEMLLDFLSDISG
ncbi:MAG: CinA family protein [Candidatus Gastranaerophilales bacterium]|nr:CinA family protein [Candidatus Gastranaerophilales bacterium]